MIHKRVRSVLGHTLDNGDSLMSGDCLAVQRSINNKKHVCEQNLDFSNLKMSMHLTLHLTELRVLVIAASNRCGESSSRVPASLSRTHTVMAADSNALLEELVQPVPSARSYTPRDNVALQIKAPTKPHFYYYQFKSILFRKTVPLVRVYVPI